MNENDDTPERGSEPDRAPQGGEGADAATGHDAAAQASEEPHELDDDSLAGVAGAALLSEEESAALFDALRSSSSDALAVRPISLGTAEEPMREAQRRIDHLAGTCAAVLRDALTRMGTSVESIDCEPAFVSPLEGWVATIPPTAGVWTVRSDGALVACVVVGPHLVTSLLERRLGAGDAVVKQVPLPRAPSPLELRLLETVPDALAAVLVQALAPGRIALGPPGRADELGSPLSPCATVSFLVTPKRGAPEVVQATLLARALGRPPAVTTGARMRDALANVEVDLLAVLGRAALDVRGLLALRQGSVIRLDGSPERPVDVCVDGVPVLQGMPLVKGGNLAIEVSS
jgi:flagellar motor switch/type III secretory pathway protein FliN